MKSEETTYKICKTCGARNHPHSGQCAGCGARLRRPMDWFSRVGLLLIVVVLIALMVYSRSKRTPTVYGNTQEPALIEFME